VLADLQPEFEGRQIDWQLETTFAVPSVNSLLCHASTCFRIGARFSYSVNVKQDAWMAFTVWTILISLNSLKKRVG